MTATDGMDERPAGPWGGYGSLEAQVAALRRARFRVGRTFAVTGRGLVAQGTVTEGAVAAGMVLLPVLERYPNIYTPLAILAVEAVRGEGALGAVGLVLGPGVPVAGAQAVRLAPGTVVDVLARAPAA